MYDSKILKLILEKKQIGCVYSLLNFVVAILWSYFKITFSEFQLVCYFTDSYL